MFVNKQFQHQQSAHCESGVASSLLRHHGLDISEPMAFGLSGAITFAYIPFVKLNGLPLTSYRMPPKSILRGIQKRLGIKFRFKRFAKPTVGMQALDNLLEQQRLVGLQTSVYWLPYFPEDMRFHFNAHNLLVYGKKGADYLISDPVLEEAVQADYASLSKARFAKGALAAKGLMYWIDEVPEQRKELAVEMRKAILANARMMLKTPVPIIGIRGIRFLAKKIRQLDKTVKKPRQIKLYLGHIVRMQEEIGTGGGGFRFIYASFLQEAATILDQPALLEASALMTAAGDQWRQFALATARCCKNKDHLDLDLLADQLLLCAEKEKQAWEFLVKLLA